MMNKRFLPALLFCTISSLCLLLEPAVAEELSLVNRPVNTSGLTGLLFTTAPFTASPGTLEISASILSENSTRPDYTNTEFPFTMTAGFGTNKEIAIRTSYFHIKEGPSTSTGIDRKTGNLELSYKWNFLPQAEDSSIPGVALMITGLAPTEKDPDSKISTISHWGMRLGLAAGTELAWKEHILGIYADAQLAGQDLTEKRLRDLYELYNAGLLFPVSKYDNLQMFVEYSLTHGKTKTSLDGGDYSALTYGLRLVSERFNFTIGTQFLHKTAEEYDNSGRIVGLMSMKFM